MSSELFSTITEATQLLRLTRKIRPFRMAIIRIRQSGVSTATYDYIFNEFDNNLITGIDGGSGIYSIGINTQSFINITQVTQESDLTHTSVTSPVVNSTFTTSNKDTLSIGVFNLDTAGFEALDGEVIIYIREFYESN